MMPVMATILAIVVHIASVVPYAGVIFRQVLAFPRSSGFVAFSLFLVQCATVINARALPPSIRKF